MAKTLLVPGTQASTLVDQTGNQIYNAVRMGLPLIAKSLGGLPKDEWVDVMSMEHTPGQLEPTRTSLQDGTEMTAGEVSRIPYDLLDYDGWPYDWRADLRWNADRLVQDLEQRLAAEGEPARLVGHSQGGLIIVLASKQAGADRWQTLVSKAALVGAPLAGTMNALEALLPGSTGLGKENRMLARAMARTWPALYQMLPSWPCVEDSHGEPRHEDDQILGPNGWPGQTGIQADLLTRAAETQALLKNPFAEFGTVEARAFMASNHKTAQELERDGDEEGKFIFNNKSGDTLVPFSRTRAWGDDAFNDAVREFRKNAQNHARLCVDVRIVTRIRRFLEGS